MQKAINTLDSLPKRNARLAALCWDEAMRYLAVFLDLDNTLYDYESVERRALQSVFTQFSAQAKLPTSQLEEIFYREKSSLRRRLKGWVGMEDRFLHIKLMVDAILVGPGRFAVARTLYEGFQREILAKMVLREGVIDCLTEWSERAQLVAVTNNLAHAQAEKLSALGIDEYFSDVVTPEDAGCMKPERGIFELALSRAGVDASDTCMIGDNVATDGGALHLSIDTFILADQCRPGPIPHGIKKFHDFVEIRSLWRQAEL